jgi:hypothetical protein
MSNPLVRAPRLPTAPVEYDAQFMAALLNALRLYFNQLDNPGAMQGSSLNLDLNTLPTDADLATLRLGDVYRDTQDGVQATSQMLRIKTSL